MEIVQKKIDGLIPYENNPRVNDGAVEYVANSIQEFGFKVPIVIDSDNVIVAGHTRLKAAKKLGLDEVPCIIADDLTEEQIKAFRLADNKTAEMAYWDDELLMGELDELACDMTEFGFEMPTFDSEVADKEESEYKEPENKLVTCPNCGLQFEPIEE